MGGIDIVLELVLVGLLAATLLHALRLQRALRSLREDRATLQDAVSGFDSGTRQAEAGLARLRDAAEQLSAQLHQAGSLRDDLNYLSDRGDTIADRLDALIRSARGLEPSYPAHDEAQADAPESARTELASVAAAAPSDAPVSGLPPPARLRSQAERSLLVALQARR